MTAISDSRLRRLFPYVAIALFEWVVYGRVLGFGFFHDDLYLIRPLGLWRFFDHSATGYYWRPVWTAFMSAEYAWFGINPVPMHAFNLALHVVACWIAFGLLVRVGFRWPVALGAVGLWSLFGGNGYVVAWISAVNDPIALILLLLATWVWVTVPAGQAPSLARATLAAGLWLLSMLTKEVALMWPWAMTAMLMVRARRGPHPAGSRAVGFALVPGLLAFAAYLSLRLAVAKAGLSTQDIPDMGGHLSGSSGLVILAGRAFHFVEALAYGFVPLDLFRSWLTLAIGALVMLAFVAALIAAIPAMGSAGRSQALIGLAWMVAFSLHGFVAPHPRTLYIATLGTAVAIMAIVAHAPLFRRNLLAGLLLIGYAGVQARLNQKALDFHSPSSMATLIHTSKLLLGNDARITPEKHEYLRGVLRYERVEDLAQLTKEEETVWRTLLQETFKRLRHPGGQP